MSDSESNADQFFERSPSPQLVPEDGPMSLRIHRPDEIKHLNLHQLNELASEKWAEEDFMGFIRLMAAGRYTGENGREISVAVDPRQSQPALPNHPNVLITRDIDSAIGYTANLSYHNAQRGLKIYQVPLFSRALKKGVHLKVALPSRGNNEVGNVRLLPWPTLSFLSTFFLILSPFLSFFSCAFCPGNLFCAST
jgi:hypothetical protein